MNERVYQSVVGVLVVAVSVVSYQLYNQEKQTSAVKEFARGVDIAAIKPKYEYISSKELLMQQQRRNKLEKVKLNSSLVELRNSTQKSLQMIQDYNEQHPNNPIAQDFELSNLQDSAYDFNGVQSQPSYEQIQQQVESTNRKIEVARSSSSTTDKRTQSLASNSSGGSYGGGSSISGASTPTSVASAESTQSTTKSSSVDDTVTPTAPSPENRLDNELVAYQASIVDITKVIQQINNNLN